jgi:hypothetical protein
MTIDRMQNDKSVVHGIRERGARIDIAGHDQPGTAFRFSTVKGRPSSHHK